MLAKIETEIARAIPTASGRAAELNGIAHAGLAAYRARSSDPSWPRADLFL
jgi:hypothetical protein